MPDYLLIIELYISLIYSAPVERTHTRFADRLQAPPKAFLLFGTARLLLHNLNASYVWNEVGLPSVESGRSNNILLDASA